jgi:hypothetical protein
MGMISSQSGLRSDASSTVSEGRPVGGNSSGSLAMMRRWSISVAIVGHAIREHPVPADVKLKA